jgi:hypothetical protein
MGRSRADRHQVGPSTLNSAVAAAAAATAATAAVTAAAASRSRAERVHFGRSVAPRCKPGRSRTYTVGQDPGGLIRVGRSGKSAPGAGPTQAGAGRTDSESELLNVNPHPPQRTGVATAEDKTGPQTLYGGKYALRQGGSKTPLRVFLAYALQNSASLARYRPWIHD